MLALLLLSGGLPAAAQVFSSPPASFSASGARVDWPEGFYDESATGDATFFVATALAFASDGRLFVAEKSGLVYVVEDGVKQETPFLDIRDEVLENTDRGVLGLALDPDFAANGRLYLVYTVDHESTTDAERFDSFGRLVRYTASTADPNVADPASRKVLIGETFAEGFPACWVAHSPNALRWGMDGTLLVSAGDGASFNLEPPDAGGLYPPCFEPGKLDPSEDIGSFRSQSLDSYGGKILRVDPETGLGLPSNPFFTGDPDDKASRVWNYGLRNPFRFAVYPDGSFSPEDGRPGTLFIGDVGWDLWEEINVAAGGENFGWPCDEGPEENPLHRGTALGPAYCSGAAGFVAPTVSWHHDDAARSNPPGVTARSLTLGDFYLGKKYPAAYQDRLFYADFIRIWIRTAGFDEEGGLTSEEGFAESTFQLVDFRYNPFTEHLYYVQLNPGTGEAQVRRLRHWEGDANQPPVAHLEADRLSGALPLTIQFTAAASTDPEGQALTYFWDFGNGNTSEEVNPTFTFTENGVHTVALIVSDPFNVSTDATVQVAAGTVTATEGEEVADRRPTLAPAFPNPFTAQTRIAYNLPHAGEVALGLYDVLGRRVRSLATGYEAAGAHHAQWDGHDEQGAPLPAGLYFYQLRLGDALVATQSVVLLR